MIQSFNGVSPRIHDTVFIADTATVIGDVEIGENASVWFGTIIRADVNHIRIGAGTNIQDACVLHVTTDTHPTILEHDITVGHRVTLHGCYVETGSLIGIGSTVLDGARIGKYSLVAAGSLVTPNTIIPPRSMVMGSPARVKRELTDAEIAAIKDNVDSYKVLAKRYLFGS